MNLFKNRLSLQEESIRQILQQTVNKTPLCLNQQLIQKYRTFTNFSYRQAISSHKNTRKKKKEPLIRLHQTIQFKTPPPLLKNQQTQNKIGKKLEKKGGSMTEQMVGLKNERRQRLKKATNTYQIVKHYMDKQGYKPNEDQMYLLKLISQIKQFTEQNNQLDAILKRIYKFMNQTVDVNQFRFLGLLILLTADICFQYKDYRRAVYFYNQARLFASYAALYGFKVQALIGIGQVALQLKFYDYSIIFMKKALQYAWRTKTIDSQLLIYDFIGQAMFYQADIKASKYYHHRFTQGQFQDNSSAIKKLSNEMLEQYDYYINSLEKKDLTSLFLQYINIPIVDLSTVTPNKNKRTIYENYDQEGFSPRKKKKNKKFQFQDFPDVIVQLQKLIKEDTEFKTQIANPDVQQSFSSSQKYGRKRKSIAFEQTPEYHKIVGYSTHSKIDMHQLHSKSIEKRIQKIFSQKSNPNWWEDMKDKMRKNQLQKVGQLRQRIRNSHLSSQKYNEDKKRYSSIKTQRIKASFNKTILDWIDPLK